MKNFESHPVVVRSLVQERKALQMCFVGSLIGFGTGHKTLLSRHVLLDRPWAIAISITKHEDTLVDNLRHFLCLIEKDQFILCVWPRKSFMIKKKFVKHGECSVKLVMKVLLLLETNKLWV